jgi:hypothetical protein
MVGRCQFEMAGGNASGRLAFKKASAVLVFEVTESPRDARK